MFLKRVALDVPEDSQVKPVGKAVPVAFSPSARQHAVAAAETAAAAGLSREEKGRELSFQDQARRLRQLARPADVDLLLGLAGRLAQKVEGAFVAGITQQVGMGRTTTTTSTRGTEIL
eukprot:jgi/Mesen1/7695/ME000405S06996